MQATWLRWKYKLAFGSKRSLRGKQLIVRAADVLEDRECRPKESHMWDRDRKAGSGEEEAATTYRDEYQVAHTHRSAVLRARRKKKIKSLLSSSAPSTWADARGIKEKCWMLKKLISSFIVQVFGDSAWFISDIFKLHDRKCWRVDTRLRARDKWSTQKKKGEIFSWSMITQLKARLETKA